jgi:hypothetical protein
MTGCVDDAQRAEEWLLGSDEPWTRYRTLVDLLGRPDSRAPSETGETEDPEVAATRDEMLGHPQVQALIAEAATWPGDPIRRHNDAGHPIYKLSTLADFGAGPEDPGMAVALDAVLAHQSAEGAFQSVVNIPRAFGGSGQDQWTWILCDAPTLLYALLAMGLGDDERVQRAVEHLIGLLDENGWRCRCAPELGRFRGPGRKNDPCPIATLLALKALAQVPSMLDSQAARAGAEMLLAHWAHELGPKVYLFGAGTDYRKLKYPFVWYDILHVLDVLSRFPFVYSDPRFGEMVAALAIRADGECRYRATSMYQTWKGWSFADKKHPSPWLTFLALRILKRVGWFANPECCGV